MAASKSKLLLSHFRSARSLSSLSTLPLARVSHLLHNSNPPTHHLLPQYYPFAAAGFSPSRSIVTSPDHIQHTSIEDSILPVRVLASLLDGCHDLTGLPWWLTIVTSTLAMRFALLPVAVMQLQKLKMMGELSRKLPPPFPPLFSGKSYINHILHYRKERKAIGCPSLLWILAPYFIQVPCFFLCLTSIRRMSLDNHPGFDCGGTLWFQDLTETPYSLLNPIFPILIAVLHNVNIQISFATSLQKADSIFELLLKGYKCVLDFMSFFLLFIGFFMPQGSLVYWVTNSSFSLIQQLFFKHPAVIARFGLPNRRAHRRGENSKEMHISENLPAEPPSKEHIITMEDLSPEELLKLSVIRLGREQHEKAISSLKLALEKDPDYVRAMVVLGNALMQKEMLVEAREYLERAISKLSLPGHPIKVEEVDLLIQSSQWTALICIKQGNEAEGLVHLERMATLQEPEDPQSKVHYYKGLLLLWSILHRANRREEAKKYASRMIAYDPSLRPLLEQLEKQGDVAIDLKVDY
ncbi:hypothetical protein SLE2022_056600 [Rubroshorea leprosula]